MCGQPVDVGRAARVRFTADKQWFFCSASHADEFRVPEATPAPVVPSFTSAFALKREPTPAAESLIAAPAVVSVEPGRAGTSQVSDGGQVRQATPFVHQETGQGWDDAPAVPSEAGPFVSSPSQSTWSASPAPRRVWSSRKAEQLLLRSVHAAPSIVLGAATVVAFFADLPFVSCGVGFVLLVAALLWEQRRGAPLHFQQWPEVLRDSQSLARMALGSGLEFKEVAQLRAGEEVLVLAGEWVCVDGVVSSGTATVTPWHGAKHQVSLGPGARVVAGARVLSGELGIVATKTGVRRAFHCPEAFLADHSQLVLAKWVCLAASPLLGAITCLLLRLQLHPWLLSVAAGAAVAGAVALPGSLRLCTSLVTRALREAAQRGIAYCNAALFERAGHVTSVVYCARGSVLHGEPDVAEVHVFRGVAEEQVLAYAAGAESAVHHPIASSVLRAAHHRGISVDGCRGHHVAPGLGVICSSSDGRGLVVGSRELLLREKVSAAIAEETLRILEARGLSTLLVALEGRLIGVLGLQDSLRAGARASFQLLLDSKMEPILLSGDARATMEAVGRALGCEHVRPEVPALGRAQEVRSLIDSGLVVAAVGNSPRDDVALSAAHVPIILEGAALIRADSPHGHERGIGLSSDRVIDSALALLIARANRLALQYVLVSWLLAASVGSLLVMSQLVPLFVAPLASLVGLFAAELRARRSAQAIYPA